MKILSETLFTYHLVNIKPELIGKEGYTPEIFTYHLVNIKLDIFFYGTYFKVNLHTT
ncbi:hypothetical protein HMPREF9945_02949 [Clostridioides difficile 70-100-2010]|nr:hypothetical protein HMPREF9945_02949 [Clostridioides difficile 70-100-2010]